MKVKEIMTKSPTFCALTTDRDIACRAVAQGKDARAIKASDCMSSPAITVTPDIDVDECCELLERRQIRRVLVVDGKDRCVGIVSLADIARKCGPLKAGEVVREVSGVPA